MKIFFGLSLIMLGFISIIFIVAHSIVLILTVILVLSGVRLLASSEKDGGR